MDVAFGRCSAFARRSAPLSVAHSHEPFMPSHLIKSLNSTAAKNTDGFASNRNLGNQRHGFSYTHGKMIRQGTAKATEEKSDVADNPRGGNLAFDGGREELSRQMKSQLEADLHSTKLRAGQGDADGPSKQGSRSSAYVAPIANISPVSPVRTTFTGDKITQPPDRLQLPHYVGTYLCGKTIDDSGDVVDSDGRIVARTGGDLPSLVGRIVSNDKGDILGDEGELLGWVSELEFPGTNRRKDKPGGADLRPRSNEAKNLFEVMGGSAAASLMVDHRGNILDSGGNVVGRLHDNNNPLHWRDREREAQKQAQKAAEGNGEASKPTATEGVRGGENGEGPTGEGAEREKKYQHRSESGTRRNAQSWRKENPGESPSDIFLDVKSTTEGIQLTIRIPTVFGGQQMKPTILFS